ncbi:MAG: glycosyltransferase [Oscillospiraceae bacterium]|nr:glycosyltransferase [Oscillospiraceae bacterium]
MRILYLSNACAEEEFYEIFTEKIKPSQAAQKYHTLQIQGLRETGQELTALCIPAISRVTYKGVFFRYRGRNKDFLFMPMVNIPLLRNIWMFLYVFFFTLFRTIGKRGDGVICDVLNTTVSMAALSACFLTRTPSVGIVTDVPTKRAFEVRNPVKKLAARVCWFQLGKFDRYIFLTHAMNDLINRKNRPYMVSEGHVDSHAAAVTDSIDQKYEKKVCIYAGSLREIYGIPYLVEAFLKADVPNAELHIYGAGEYEQTLWELSEKYPSVRFFGLMPNEHIVREERKATLLINPRPTDEEYTKYSFPSKNMEYMVSGTPVLTTKLPGMPEEYEEFVYLIPQENADALAQELRKLLCKSAEELFAFGQRAKTFVLENKNNVKQAERICRFLSNS